MYYHAAKVLRFLVLMNHLLTYLLSMWQAMEMLSDHHFSHLYFVHRYNLLSPILKYSMVEVAIEIIP